MAAHESNSQVEQFALWVREHSRAVRGYLLGMVRRADAADDLLQEVFRRAWQARESYRENGHSRAYLLKIADRLVCDRHRQARPEVTLDRKDWEKNEPLGPEKDPLEAFSRQEETAALHRALRSLSPIQRRVLLLRYYGQMSFAEIAEEVQCPLATTLSHCRRGLESLRKILVK